MLLSACTASFESRAPGPFPEPVQKSLGQRKSTLFLENGYWLQPVASYEVDALVQGVQRYRWDDTSSFMPVDLALAWGKLAEPHVAPLVRVKQEEREFVYFLDDVNLAKQLGQRGIISSMANTHIIPSSEEVRDILLSVRAGQAIRAKGLLVDLMHKDEKKIVRTSRNRKDVGRVGNEVFYVVNLEVFETGR